MYLLLARLLRASHRRHIALLTGGFVTVVVLGAALFSAVEGIGYGTGLYWAITTATTVGYGDVTPKSGAGQVVASALMLTAIPMLGSLFALLAGASVSAGIRRIMDDELDFPANGFRLVVGNHVTNRAIVAQLLEAGEDVALVADVDPTAVADRVRLVRGDPTQPAVLSRGRPSAAAHILVTGSSDGDTLVSAVLLRELAPDVPMTALSMSGGIRPALDALGVNETLSVDELVAHTLAKSLETPHAGRLLVALLESDEHVLVEAPAPADLVGATLSSIRRSREGLVLGLVQGGRVRLGIASDPVVGPDDLLLLAEPLGLRKALEG